MNKKFFSYFIIIISITSFILFYFKLFKKSIFKNKEKTLNILSWPGSISYEIIKKFEDTYGVKINISYYTSNEELTTKLIFTNGKDLDIIIPSDYTVQILKSKNLILEIDKNKIKNFNLIYKNLLTKGTFDQKIFAIPFEWFIFGISIKEKNLSLFENEKELINSFFNGNYNKKNIPICMTNDSMTAINIIDRYYHENFNNKIVDKEALFTIIYETLKKQKKNVIAYSDMRISDLFYDDSIYMAYLQHFEYIKALKKNKDLKFIIIPFGTLQTIEYICIPKESSNVELAYNFINFLISEDTLLLNVKFDYSLPILNSLLTKKEYPKEFKEIITRCTSDDINFFFSKEILNEEDRALLWMLLKS
jgi:spermidine/putrescine-binding protein